MKLRDLFLMISVCLLVFSGIAYGAEVPKIAVIDLQKVIDNSEAGKRSSEEIKSQGKKMENTLKDKGAEIEQLQTTLDQKALVLSDEARGEKEKDLREKVSDLKALQRRYQDALRDLNASFSKQIMKDVFEIAEGIGKEEGYTLIIDRRAGGVIYSPDTIDITDKITEKYNAMEAKRSKEKKTSKEGEKK